LKTFAKVHGKVDFVNECRVPDQSLFESVVLALIERASQIAVYQKVLFYVVAIHQMSRFRSLFTCCISINHLTGLLF
jgi:hypothetical protein